MSVHHSNKLKSVNISKPGLSDLAKKVMLERDQTRQKISGAKGSEKATLKAKYKNLRNRTIAQIRKDTIQTNRDRISEAKNEGEIWRVVNIF